MIDAGINDKDILAVDRSLEPTDNKVVVCFVDGEFTVKRIKLETDCLYLIPENKKLQTNKNQRRKSVYYMVDSNVCH